MKIGCAFQLATMACAILAGLGFFSFWWVLIPVFFAGSFQLSNGPAHSMVLRANEDGRLGVFPALLVANILPWLAIAGAAYWITRAIHG